MRDVDVDTDRRVAAVGAEPAVGAGRSSVTVKVSEPIGVTVGATGVSEAAMRGSAAVKARTVAVAMLVLSVAVSVATPASVELTSTCADVWPISTVTPPPTTETAPPLFELIDTAVFISAGPERVTVSGVGNVGAELWPAAAKPLGPKSRMPGAPVERSSIRRGKSVDARLRYASTPVMAL